MTASPASVLSEEYPEAILLPRRHRPGLLVRAVSFLLGWAWRITAGAALCFNFFVLSYITSVAVMGWLYRWMQARVLYGWWKQSRLRQTASFEDFCVSLGPDAPVLRPRWLLRERIGAHRERASGGIFARFFFYLSVPWHSLWLNFKIGFQAIFCTYLVTGIGCLVMLMSWEYGWLNSFNRHYEQAFVGPAFGILGSLLFIAALYYVLMAQAHQAATGEARAFFDFRFIWRLIQVRPTAYVALALLLVLISFIFEGLRVFVLSENFPGNHEALSAAQGLDYLRQYLFACSAGLFVTLLLLRGIAAAVYRSAVLKVLRLGWVKHDELHPLLARWLRCLDLMPRPVETPSGLGNAIRATGHWWYRRVLLNGLIVIWLIFVMRFYVGYFLLANGYLGFLNHPLVQLPCFDHTPAGLVTDATP